MAYDEAQRGPRPPERKTSSLYRMATPDHVCPFGLKSKALLKRQGFAVEDHLLRSREETDAFKRMHNVETTPQAFIAGERVGGYDALKRYFGKGREDSRLTPYQPVIAVFGMAALIALAFSIGASAGVFRIRVLEWFIATAMCLLAVLKLRDIEGFTNQFLSYDLLAQRFVRYASIYPFAEALAGVLMIAGVLIWIAAPVALFIGAVGAVSVAKAVYIDRRELKCACVGGDSKTPLGAVSLTENLMMVAMGAWMLAK